MEERGHLFHSISKEAAHRYAEISDFDFLKLEEAFEVQGPRGPKFVLLHGPSGSGKTSLAKYFAFEKAQRGDFRNVVWFNGHSDETIWATFLQLRCKCQLRSGYRSEEGWASQDASDVINNVLLYLNQERTLLVFDGLTGTSHVKRVLEKYIPNNEGFDNLHVLATATEECGAETSNLKTVNLSSVFLRDRRVLSTLLKNTGSEQEYLLNLLWSFGTLAKLETAAKVYRFLEVLEEEPPLSSHSHGQGNVVENLWLHCFEKLKSSEKYREALELIDVCCLFGPGDVPLAWLQDIFCVDVFKQDISAALALLQFEQGGTTVATWSNVQRFARLKALVQSANEPKLILFFRDFLAKFTELIASIEQIEFEQLGCVLEKLLWIVEKLTSSKTSSSLVLVRDIVSFVLNIHENPWCQQLTLRYLIRIRALQIKEEIRVKVIERLEYDGKQAEEHLPTQMAHLTLNPGATRKPPSRPIRNFNFKLQVPSVWANRDEDLETLVKLLEAPRILGSEDSNVVVIHGMGGAGKTVLAQYYACWAYLQERFVNYIWIDASSYSSMARDFKTLMVSGLNLAPLPEGANAQMAAEAVYNSILGDRTLIVFDNAFGGEPAFEDDSIQGFLPAICTLAEMLPPTVIVTTRNGGAWDGLRLKLLSLGVLETACVETYFINRLVLAEVPFAEEQIQKIVESAQGHPVLMVAAVREVLDKRSVRRFLDLVSEDQGFTATPAVNNLCFSMINDLECHPYGSVSLAILKVCALIPRRCSLESIFQVLKAYPPIKKLRAPDDRILNGLATLLNFSLVHVINGEVCVSSVLKDFLLLQHLSDESEENREFLVSCLPPILYSCSTRGSDGIPADHFERIEKNLRNLELYPEYAVLQRAYENARMLAKRTAIIGTSDFATSDFLGEAKGASSNQTTDFKEEIINEALAMYISGMGAFKTSEAIQTAHFEKQSAAAAHMINELNEANMAPSVVSDSQKKLTFLTCKELAFRLNQLEKLTSKVEEPWFSKVYNPWLQPQNPNYIVAAAAEGVPVPNSQRFASQSSNSDSLSWLEAGYQAALKSKAALDLDKMLKPTGTGTAIDMVAIDTWNPRASIVRASPDKIDRLIQLDQTDQDFEYISSPKFTFVPETTTEVACANLMKKLTSNLKKLNDTTIEKAVVLVSPSFTDSQRRAIMKSASALNFEAALLNSTTASAIGYMQDEFIPVDEYLLVLELSDNSIQSCLALSVKNGVSVKSVSYSMDIGENTFLANLVSVILFQRFGAEQVWTNSDIKHVVDRVRSTLKISASPLEDLLRDFGTRNDHVAAKFESVSSEAKSLIRLVVDDVLGTVYKDIEVVKHVVLVGQGWKLPMLKYLIQDMFQGKPKIHVDLAGDTRARGAAFVASLLVTPPLDRAFRFKDITSHFVSARIQSDGEITGRSIQRNTEIPTTKYFIGKLDCTYINSVEVSETRFCEQEDQLSQVTKEYRSPQAGLGQLNISVMVDSSGLIKIQGQKGEEPNDENIVHFLIQD